MTEVTQSPAPPTEISPPDTPQIRPAAQIPTSPVAATEQPDEIDRFLESMVRDLPGSWTYLPEEKMLALLLQDNITVPMCGPLRITTRICSADKKSWARRISFLDHGGELHSETIPDKDLQGSARNLCARLAAHGLASERRPPT